MDDLGAPTSYLALAKGVPVFDADGARIGTVEHVLADDAKDIFDGLVIDTRLGPGGLRFADAEQVARLHERGVVLNVSGSALHRPGENPAALEADPADDESGLSERLRRAWSWISGRY